MGLRLKTNSEIIRIEVFQEHMSLIRWLFFLIYIEINAQLFKKKKIPDLFTLPRAGFRNNNM